MSEQTEPAQDGPSGGLSYEDARDQLVEVVRTLEGGGTSLAESLALWERGEELARVCQEALEGARERLDAALED
ncbi:exodeoxyribonuclease VII small subunit [Marmoricola sp. Leaf446]|uniref:exodeoxyribonuclease VII small subunit n=1 Tax=Marmoricola sp. Leaf446 TaxID=1736379 RepID=UPI0006FFA531|nr:exodeoxyribonuclease VII small subunit [Marmoricola sp. Leaf446]KQT91505.1 exodeoxyribonuclease VII small subunit [Marmoricola sp. Leaf446]